jgi:hypothetical protein
LVTVTKIDTRTSVTYEIEATAGESAHLLVEAVSEVMKLDASANLATDTKLVFFGRVDNLPQALNRGNQN